jgi:hypothetical protein
LRLNFSQPCRRGRKEARHRHQALTHFCTRLQC